MPPKKKISGEPPTHNVPPPQQGSDEPRDPMKDKANNEVVAVHPIQDKKVAFTGVFDKKVKKEHDARIKQLGGKIQRTFCSTTDFLVKAKDAPDLRLQDAVSMDIPIWTEEQLQAVCESGWSAVPPPTPTSDGVENLMETTGSTMMFGRP